MELYLKEVSMIFVNPFKGVRYGFIYCWTWGEVCPFSIEVVFGIPTKSAIRLYLGNVSRGN